MLLLQGSHGLLERLDRNSDPEDATQFADLGELGRAADKADPAGLEPDDPVGPGTWPVPRDRGST
jgi:hypothetical protein